MIQCTETRHRLGHYFILQNYFSISFNLLMWELQGYWRIQKSNLILHDKKRGKYFELFFFSHIFGFSNHFQVLIEKKNLFLSIDR